jgi:hypothetical protein
MLLELMCLEDPEEAAAQKVSPEYRQVTAQ